MLFRLELNGYTVHSDFSHCLNFKEIYQQES